MSESRARKIFANIFSEDYTAEEKLQAVAIVCLLSSLNGISKEEMRAAICWLAGHQYDIYLGQEPGEVIA